jgi:nicotianamine synthase
VSKSFSVDTIVEINRLYEEISQLKDFSPGEKVNDSFSRLVQLAMKYDKKIELCEDKKQHLQQLSAEAEYQLEKYWADKIINSVDPVKELETFPYFKNYQDLTTLEYNSLHSCVAHKDHKFIFIGGGFLPLTSMVLASKYNTPSTIIDIDKEVTAKSRILIKVLKLDHLIDIQNSAGQTFNYQNYNIIFVAALAGLDSETKTEIFNQIKSTAPKGSHIVARSSWNNRELLYRPIDESIYKSFTPIIKVDPFHDVINSVVILENA